MVMHNTRDDGGIEDSDIWNRRISGGISDSSSNSSSISGTVVVVAVAVN